MNSSLCKVADCNSQHPAAAQAASLSKNYLDIHAKAESLLAIQIRTVMVGFSINGA